MSIKVEERDLSKIRCDSSSSCCFSFLDIGLQLFTDHLESLNTFKNIYKNFVRNNLPETSFKCYILKKSSFHKWPCIIIDNTLYKLPNHEDFISWAELIIFQSIMEAMDSHLLLHAGVVEKDGNAYIIYAPSGFGKTTLVLELVSRGYSFFSDEYCPVNLSDFSITPFPRMLGLRGNNPFYYMIEKTNAPLLEHENKSYVNCNDIFPGMTGKTCKAKYLMILTNESKEETGSRPREDVVDVVLFKENSELLRELSNYAEVEVVEKVLRGFYVGYRLKMPKNKQLVKKLQTIWQKYKEGIFCVGIVSDRKPDFKQTPSLEKMTKTDTIFEMLTHLMNRAPTGKLMQRFDGKISNLILAIGNFVRDLKCYRMSPGHLQVMADIVDNLD